MKIKLKWQISKYAFLLILATACVFQLQAQMISQDPADYPSGTTFSNCPGPLCEITLPGIKANQVKDYEIPILETPDNIYVSNIYGSCIEITNNNSVTNADNIVTVTVNERCPSGASYISFVVNAEKSGFTPEQHKYVVPILRDTIKIALVLDISGSMGLLVQGDTKTRIESLKEAVMGLVFKLEELQQGMGDSLAMTYFSSTIIQPNAPIDSGFIVIDNTDFDYNNHSSTKVYNDLDPRAQLQMTALGEGLIDAKNKLDLDDSENLKRMVFLFTDGLQNYGNQLKTDGLTFYHGDDSLNNYQSNPKDSIYYFPVATWGAGTGPELFEQIVDANKGEVVFASPYSDLETWFNTQFVNMLEGGSPQIITEKKANSVHNPVNYKFNLNDNIQSLLIEIKSASDVNMKIIKDGIDLTSKARVKNYKDYNLISFHFPIINQPIIKSGGEWELILNGESEKTYFISVIADDHFTNYDCSLNKPMYTVGETMLFNIDLSHRDKPISTPGNSVTAIVLKPGNDLGHLLSTFETPVSDNFIDMDSEANQKFNNLLSYDIAFYNALLPNEQIIELTDNGNGNFTGSFNSTELAGIYNVVYLIKANTENHGKIERTKSLSTLFVFGNMVEEEPEVVDNAPKPGSGNPNNYMVLKIRPKNKFGYFMGPGFKSKIKVNSKSQVVKTHKAESIKQDNNIKEPYLMEIKDNLDGSYFLYIANITDSEKWDFNITVRDEILYNYAKTLPVWVYILLLVFILLIYLVKKSKRNKTIAWILTIVWFLIIVVHYLGFLNLL